MVFIILHHLDLLITVLIISGYCFRIFYVNDSLKGDQFQIAICRRNSI